MKNCEFYKSAREAEKAFTECPCMHQTWCAFIWAYTEHTGDELADLRALENAGLYTAALGKRIKQLEKAGGAK